MLIAVGMYLPFPTTFAIFIGGIIKYFTDKYAMKEIKKEKQEAVVEEKKSKVESTGLLVASGLVAGEALIGIILAILVVSEIDLNKIFGNGQIEAGEFVANTGLASLGFLVLAILAFILIYFPLKAIKNKK